LVNVTVWGFWTSLSSNYLLEIPKCSIRTYQPLLLLVQPPRLCLSPRQQHISWTARSWHPMKASRGVAHTSHVVGNLPLFFSGGSGNGKSLTNGYLNRTLIYKYWIFQQAMFDYLRVSDKIYKIWDNWGNTSNESKWRFESYGPFTEHGPSISGENPAKKSKGFPPIKYSFSLYYLPVHRVLVIANEKNINYFIWFPQKACCRVYGCVVHS
jgi:hypothetical protein